MLNQKKLFVSVLLLVASFRLAGPSMATDEHPSEVTLFKNVNIFDRVSEQLKMGYDVLIVRNKIHKIGKNLATAGSYEVEVASSGEKKVKVLSDFTPSTYTIRVKDGEAKTKKSR
jgi:hypothetical protein